ncbi:MAG: hypothetical protein HFE46_07155 [Clostridia bacterium]|jgi:hypothetical protein|nr:hypothetical protein [Clostridia bacterium]
MSNLMELLEKNEAERTPEQNEAMYVHEQIALSCRMVANGYVGLGRYLKEMRDKKLYLQLGYKDFDSYTEAEHGIKQRAAYNYISALEQLGAEFLHSNAKLGITKFVALAALGKDEREELLAAHSIDELDKMNVEEVKQLTAQVKKLEEQISFLQEEKRQRESEPAQVEQRPFAEIESEIRAEIERDLNEKHAAEIAELESQLAAAEAKKVDAEELEQYRENAEKEAKAAVAEETKKLKEELKEVNRINKNNLNFLAEMTQAKKKEEEARKAAEEKAQKAEEQAKRAAELEAQIAAAQAEKDAAEKQIKLSADPEYTRFKFMFEQWQQNMSALVEQISKLDADKQEKVKQAIRKVWEVSGL